MNGRVGWTGVGGMDVEMDGGVEGVPDDGAYIIDPSVCTSELPSTS